MRRLQHVGLTQVAAEAAFRAEARRALATLTRVLGDLDRAEDAVQDAFVVALEQWPRSGIPDKPGAWITTTARHKAIDRLRAAGAPPPVFGFGISGAGQVRAAMAAGAAGAISGSAIVAAAADGGESAVRSLVAELKAGTRPR